MQCCHYSSTVLLSKRPHEGEESNSEMAKAPAGGTLSLIKFPRTAHLFDTGGTATTSDDLVLPDVEAVASTFCNGKTRVYIEEKIDGANLGISVDPQTQEILVQNRSHYISGIGGNHAQFNRIHEWTARHREALYELLGTRDRILYGEWLVARHSIPYQRLPDIFVAFDLYDKTEKKFLSRERFHLALKGSGIPVVPVIFSVVFEKKDAKKFRQIVLRLLESSRSAFRSDDGPVEGIVLRIDSEPRFQGDGTWLKNRYKIVRPDFLRGCGEGQHWSKRKIEKQRVDFDFAVTYLENCYCLAGSADNT
jgi:atypical dual specificity phosphatase